MVPAGNCDKAYSISCFHFAQILTSTGFILLKGLKFSVLIFSDSCMNSLEFCSLPVSCAGYLIDGSLSQSEFESMQRSHVILSECKNQKKSSAMPSSYLSNGPLFLWVYQCNNQHGMLGEHDESL